MYVVRNIGESHAIWGYQIRLANAGGVLQSHPLFPFYPFGGRRDSMQFPRACLNLSIYSFWESGVGTQSQKNKRTSSSSLFLL